MPDGDTLSFNDTAVGVGRPNGWDSRAVKLWGLQTTFERVVGTDAAGNTVTSVTMGCDPPDMMLLARKGDIDYWTSGEWVTNRKERRGWCADIARRMLQDGHISTWDGTGVEGIRAAMNAAGTPEERRQRPTPHLLTETVAKIRGLRLLQSMITESWSTTLDGYNTRRENEILLRNCFFKVRDVYDLLPKPPWTDADGVPWGPQLVAGHATDINKQDVFVGENGDLIWRALTETDHTGLSPVKAAVNRGATHGVHQNIAVAAALYDDTAREQLTTGLFAGAASADRAGAQVNAAAMFTAALHPEDGSPSRWTEEQQNRISGFIDVTEGLEP